LRDKRNDQKQVWWSSVRTSATQGEIITCRNTRWD